MAVNTINATTNANNIPEIWSRLVSDATQADCVLADLVDRSYESEMRHGDILRINDMSNPAIRVKSTDTVITYSNITETQQAITINRHAYGAFLVEDFAEVQANIDLRGKYTSKAGYSLTAYLEGDVTSGLASLPANFSQATGALGVEITQDALLEAIQKLDDGDVPESDRFFYCNPAAKVSLLKMDIFTNSEHVGASDAVRAVRRAEIGGLLYGARVFISTLANNSPAAAGQAYNWLCNKRGVALIMQRRPMTHVQWDQDNIGWSVVIDMIYQFAERLIAPSTLGGGTSDDRFNVAVKGN